MAGISRLLAALVMQCAISGCSAPDLAATNAQRLAGAIDNGLRWMHTRPATERRRFDALIGAAVIRRLYPTPQAEDLFRELLSRVDSDGGHPQRRLFEKEFKIPKEISHGWKSTDAERVNPNRVITEALHCKDHGLREQTLVYLCGPMRDSGGYHTTHALWALIIATDADCVARDDTCFAELQQELQDAQPARFAPENTLDVDLYAERLLFLLESGSEDPRYQTWVNNLLAAQNADGSFGIDAEGESSVYRYHATLVATWAFARWREMLSRE